MKRNRKPSTTRRSRLPSALLGPALAFGAHWCLSACEDSTDSGRMTVGTESHFLVTCADDADCGELSCFDGVCSLACDSDDDCSALTSESSCMSTASAPSCVVDCASDSDCDGLGSETCRGGYCEGHGADDPSAPPSVSGNETTTTDTASSTDGEVTATDGEGNDPTVNDAQMPDASTNAAAETDGGPVSEPSSSDPATSDSGAPEAGTLTPDTDPATADPDAGSGMSGSEPYACIDSSDCVLATRIDVCCPECQEAFARSYVEAEACVYADGEAAPTGCQPADCPDGCPGAACGVARAAVCVAGSCAVEVEQSSCGTCAAGELCILDPESGYQCAEESCEFDSCHPERCDEIGERCCDPFPGDGVNYCNGGLECTGAACEAPAGIEAARLCGGTLCPEGEVCCDKCTGDCVNALSGAACPDDNDPARICASDLPCGDDVCNAEVQYCSRRSVGPSPQVLVYGCVPLPDACTDDPTCECWLASAQYGSCSEADGGGLIIDTLGE